MWFFCWVLPQIGEPLFVPDRVPPVQRSSFLVSRKRHSMSTVYVFIQTFEDKACHPERSEGSGSPDKEILRCAQSLRKTRSEGMTARTSHRPSYGRASPEDSAEQRRGDGLSSPCSLATISRAPPGAASLDRHKKWCYYSHNSFVYVFTAVLPCKK